MWLVSCGSNCAPGAAGWEAAWSAGRWKQVSTAVSSESPAVLMLPSPELWPLCRNSITARSYATRDSITALALCARGSCSVCMLLTASTAIRVVRVARMWPQTMTAATAARPRARRPPIPRRSRNRLRLAGTVGGARAARAAAMESAVSEGISCMRHKPWAGSIPCMPRAILCVRASCGEHGAHFRGGHRRSTTVTGPVQLFPQSAKRNYPNV